jgi:hypothetical protein
MLYTASILAFVALVAMGELSLALSTPRQRRVDRN